jgi:hypothetical protein
VVVACQKSSHGKPLRFALLNQIVTGESPS